MSDELRAPRRANAQAPDLWCIVYGGLVVGVSDRGLTLHMLPRKNLNLIAISKEDLPCIVNF